MILDKPTTSDTTQGGACALEVGADMDEEKLQELLLLWDGATPCATPVVANMEKQCRARSIARLKGEPTTLLGGLVSSTE